MKTVTIFLKPKIETQDDEFEDDYNLLYQQGYNTSAITVEAGETFEISEDFEAGYIDCDDDLMIFKYKDEDFAEEIESYEQIVLSPGKYKFLEDGFTFINL